MNDKNKTNGKAPHSAGAAAAENVATKPEASQSVVGEKGQFDEKNVLPEAQPAPSVEEKISRVNALNKLIADRATMRTHLERVEALTFGDYADDKDTITLSKGTDKTTYTVKSTGLCKKIAALLKEEITAKIKEVEEQINF